MHAHTMIAGCGRSGRHPARPLPSGACGARHIVGGTRDRLGSGSGDVACTAQASAIRLRCAVETPQAARAFVASGADTDTIAVATAARRLTIACVIVATVHNQMARP